MLVETKTKNQAIPYSVRVSRRARRLRVAVYCDSRVVLTLPVGFDFNRAEEFIKAKLGWITKALNYFKRFEGRVFIKSGKREYYKHRAQALSLAKSKVEQWNKFYNFSYNRVSIKNQKTRWGSCSKKGNLNFNYKVVHLPEDLLNYLVVHELCHLRELNHSSRFWELVAKTVPNYKILRQKLKDFNYGQQQNNVVGQGSQVV